LRANRKRSTAGWSRRKLFALSAAGLIAVELLFAITGIHKRYSPGPHHRWATFALSTPLVLVVLALAFYLTRPRNGT
jgi:hypothetical protein